MPQVFTNYPGRALYGDNVTAYIYNRFMGLGWPPMAAAALVGAFMVESRLNPTAVGDEDLATPSYGLAQWRVSRFADLQEYAQQWGLDWTDLDLQIGFVDRELRDGVYEWVGYALRSASTVEEAAEAVAGYEGGEGYSPENPRGIIHWDQRLANAEMVYAHVPIGPSQYHRFSQNWVERPFEETTVVQVDNSIPSAIAFSTRLTNPSDLTRRLVAGDANPGSLPNPNSGVATVPIDRDLRGWDLQGPLLPPELGSEWLNPTPTPIAPGPTPDNPQGGTVAKFAVCDSLCLDRRGMSRDGGEEDGSVQLR
ncbi:MAG: hypothetical protein KIS96_10915 [Bauldia sp.]|nr:hypothetical protein [Bauldia sp.]